ncbi:MAG: hypothetical protein ACR2RF_18805 [Geminicoccaceae bacterium]
MSESRLTTVSAAATKKVVALKCGEAFCFITDEQWDEIIQAAIEANDAWLATNIWPLAKNLDWRLSGPDGKIGDWEPLTVARAAVQSLGKPEPIVELKLAEAPTPEDTDR